MSTSKAQVTPDAGTAERHRGTVRDASVPDGGNWLTRVADQLVEKDRDKRPSWYNDPVLFAETCIEWPAGQSLAAYQKEIMRAVPEHRRVSARGPHGLGKSALAALLILWFSLSRDAAGEDWKVICTASAFRQLERFLFPEVHLWAHRIKWDVVGRRPFDQTQLMLTTLRLDHGQVSVGTATDPALLEGAHASSILVVFDEAKSIPAGTWEALEGALSGQGEAYAVAVSTPGSPSDVFHSIHAKVVGYSDWWVRHVRLDEALSAGRISPTWAEARKVQWGEQSSIYANRVLGEFKSSDEDSVVPFEWVQDAIDRWEDWRASGEDPGPVTVAGCDIARMGADETVLALRCGDIITELRRSHLEDTMQTTGRIVGVLEANPQCKPVIDIIGLGSGVFDRLKELGYRRTSAFNASAGTTRKDRSKELGFVNTRSAAWWNLREMLDPTFDPVLCLPPDDLLLGDLTAPRYSVTSTGKIQIESKDEIRKRLGRSTDSGDAVVMASFDAARGVGHAFMDWMLEKKAVQDAEPPKPPTVFQSPFPILGKDALVRVSRPCRSGEHRFFGEERRCAFCGLSPEEVENFGH